MEQAEFLSRVRAAVAPRDGNRPGPRQSGSVDQAADAALVMIGDDAVGTFLSELGLVGGVGYHARTTREAIGRLRDIVRAAAAQRAVVWRHRLLSRLGVMTALAEAGLDVLEVSESVSERDRATQVAEADLGVTAADYAIAETGTLVLYSRPGQARSVSLLPPVHVAVLGSRSVFPSLEALAPVLTRDLEGGRGPSNIVCITGPSRTGDIELSLTRGVHGPKELYVIALEEEPLGRERGERTGESVPWHE
jgi:L-lactate dehydrogenase complex protein LldG